MGRTPCCDKKGLKKGPWTSEEDEKLVEYIKNHGHGSWRSLPHLAGLARCGKSCRLRWTNYLRPDIIRGPFSPEEQKLVIQLHGILGNRLVFAICSLVLVFYVKDYKHHLYLNNYCIIITKFSSRWAAIASQLPGRTDNEIKNLWNTHLKKRLLSMGIDPQTHEQYSDPNGLLRRPATSSSARHLAQWESARLEAEARLSRESQFLVPSSVGRSVCQSPASQASSCTKYGSASGITTEVELGGAGSPVTRSNQNEYKEWKIGQPYTEDFLQGSDTSSSNAMEDSSESALQLLLDFPSNNDMSFLGHSDSYSLYP